MGLTESQNGNVVIALPKYCEGVTKCDTLCSFVTRDKRRTFVLGKILLKNDHYSPLGAKTKFMRIPAAEVKPKWACAKKYNRNI